MSKYHKHPKEATIVSLNNYQDVMDSLGVVIFEIDPHGYLTFANEHAFTLSGYTREDFEDGIYIFDLFLLEERERLLANIVKKLSGIDTGNQEYTLIKKDGTPLHGIFNSRTIISKGRVVGLRGVFTDITQRKRSEDAIRRLFTNITHDLRTPMTSILGYLEAIIDGVIAPEKEHSYLKLIYNRALSLNRLTGNLLSLALLESRQVSLQLDNISLTDLLADVFDKYRLDVEASGMILDLIEVDDSGYVPNVFVDLHQIDRAFANIIYNAIKFSPENSKISLGFKIYNKEVVIYIKDEGIGIENKDLPFIFGRLFMGEKTRKSKIGSGLGLAIAREIIELHDGRIYAESEKNAGSTFYIVLPIKESL